MAHCKICTNDNFDEWYACPNCYNLYLISDIEKLKADLALANKRVGELERLEKEHADQALFALMLEDEK